MVSSSMASNSSINGAAKVVNMNQGSDIPDRPKGLRMSDGIMAGL